MKRIAVWAGYRRNKTDKYFLIKRETRIIPFISKQSGNRGGFLYRNAD
jgi:hypothetical protein